MAGLAAVVTGALALSACQVASSARASDGSGDSTPDADEQQTALTESVEEYLGRNPGLIASIAVGHGDTTIGFGDQQRFETASVVKVEIAVRWLLLRDSELPDEEYRLAERMLTASDNEATSELCELLAEEPAPESDPIPGATGTCVGEPGWGTDETTAADQRKLLSAAFESELLSESNREVLTEFMGGVEPAQSWGVPAAANEGEVTLLKNGWDVRGNGWLAHSEGVIDSLDGEPVHMAVLTNGSHSEAEGIRHVEDLAKLARDALG